METNLKFKDLSESQFNALIEALNFAKSVMVNNGIFETSERLAVEKIEDALNPPVKCPECLNLVSQQEPNTFGGLCEDCMLDE